MANVNIRIGKKDAAYFAASSSLVLKDGQLIYNQDSGDLFIGDNITTLGSLTPINAGAGAGAAWGSITGTLSNQTDLQNALNAKGTSPEQTVPIGRWFHQLCFGPRNYAQTGADEIRYWPVYIDSTITIDALGHIFVNSSNIRIGLYTSNSNNYPSTLLYDSGNISVAGLAFYTHTIASPITLTKGVYFLAYQSQVNATGGVCKNICVVTDTQNININADKASVLIEYIAYGAFPVNPGTLYALTTNNVPLIYMRRSA